MSFDSDGASKRKTEMFAAFDDCQKKYVVFKAAQEDVRYASNRETQAMNEYNSAKKKWEELSAIKWPEAR